MLSALLLVAVPAFATPVVTAPAADMHTARNMHTLTLLNDGTVLAAGGQPTDRTAELYDPLDGSWTLVGQLASGGRGWHAAVRLLDGRVLLAGGVSTDGNASRTAELYDPATRTFSMTGMLATRRALYTLTLLPDGRVVAIGGAPLSTGAGATNVVEIYDPATGSFSDGGRLRVNRYAHSAMLLPDGRILVAGGGSIVVRDLLFDSEIYDPASRTSSAGPAMNGAHVGGVLLPLPGGRSLLASGWTQIVPFTCVTGGAELWTGSAWVATAAMGSPHVLAIGGLLPSGRALVTGDFCGNRASEVYDFAAGTWGAGPSLSASRGWAQSVTLRNGVVLVSGGALNAGVPRDDGAPVAQAPSTVTGDLFGEQPPAPVLAAAPATAVNHPIVLAGYALPDTVVTLSAGAVALAETASDGEFTLAFAPVTEGAYALALTQTAVVFTSEPLELELIYDVTAPALALAPAAGAVFDVDDQVTLAATPSDALSGVASLALTVDGEPVANGTVLAAGELAPGDHVFAAEASDAAGNAASASTSFTIAPTSGGVCSLAQSLESRGAIGHGEARSLCVLLANAEALLARGKLVPAAQLLRVALAHTRDPALAAAVAALLD